jgi:DNA-binding CsgD family transcriptional regulator
MIFPTPPKTVAESRATSAMSDPRDAVSARVLIDLLERCARRGIDRGTLLAGIVDRPELHDRGRRLSWSEFTRFLENLLGALGATWELERIAGETVEGNRALQVIGGLALSPRQLYVHVCERLARSLYRNLGGRVDPMPDGRIRVEVTIPDGQEDSLPFMHFTMGVFRAFPRLIGLEPALLEADLTPRRGVYLITPPASRSIPDLAGQMLATPLGRIFSNLQGEQPTTGDLLEAIELAYDESSMLELAREVGQRLAAHVDVEALSDDLVEVLRTRFCCRHVVLSRVGASTELEVVRSYGDGTASTRSTRPLTLAGREIGRLEVDLPSLTSENSAPFFNALLPWIAVGLDSCRGGPVDPVRDRSRTVADAARAWQLTPRQQQVLELLLRGCTNREIGAALGASVKTVEVHVSRLLRKSETGSRAALIAKLWPSR